MVITLAVTYLLFIDGFLILCLLLYVTQLRLYRIFSLSLVNLSFNSYSFVDVFHPQTILALEGMAKCYEKQDKLEQCIQCLQRIVLVVEMSNSDNADSVVKNNDKIFSIMGHMAELYLLSGQTVIAKELLQKIEVSSIETFGEQSFERGRVLMALAGCMDILGEIAEAESTLILAVGLSGYNSCVDDSRKVSASNGFFNLGVILYQQNKFVTALPHFEKALEFKIRGKVDRNDPDLIETKNRIVECKKNI